MMEGIPENPKFSDERYVEKMEILDDQVTFFKSLSTMMSSLKISMSPDSVAEHLYEFYEEHVRDPDGIFANNESSAEARTTFKSFIENAIKRNKEVMTVLSYIKTHQSEGIKIFPGVKAEFNEIVRIIPEPFTISIVLTDDAFDKIFNKPDDVKKRGGKAQGTNAGKVSFITQSRDDTNTYEHEKLHSLHRISEATEFKIINVKEQAVSHPDNFLETEPSTLVNQIHQEVVATLDDASDKNFSEGKFSTIEPNKSIKRDPRLAEYTSSLSTAGLQFILGMQKQLCEVTDEAQDPSIRKHAATLGIKSREIFVDSIFTLSTAAQFLKEKFPEDEELLWTLTTILVPSKYNRIDGYLSYKYPEEWPIFIEEKRNKYSEYTNDSLLPYGRDMLKNFRENVTTGKIVFTEDIKKGISKSFEIVKNSIYTCASEIRFFEELHNYIADMQWLIEQASDGNSPQDLSEYMKNSIYNAFLDSIFVQPKIEKDKDEAIVAFLDNEREMINAEDASRLSKYRNLYKV